MGTLQDALNDSAYGAYGKFIGHTLFGLNHEQRRPILRNIPEGEALVFFTRPYFNMSKTNLRNNRVMTNLIVNEVESVQTYIRQTLDPDVAENESTYCSLVNPNCAFVPVLSNTILNMSGWPDRILPTFASKPGARGEQFSLPDGIVETNGKFDLTFTFEKMDGDINEKLLTTWMDMMSLQNDGICVPYVWHEAYKEKNYDSRIYVLVMDVTNRIVLDIATAISTFPVNDNKGAKFNISNRKRVKENEFSVRFEANLIQYSDPILLLEFNLASARFNRDVFNLITGKSHNLHKVAPVDFYKYKNNLIPIIDFETNELCWYANNDSRR